MDTKVLFISECVINECVRKKYPLNTSKLMKLLYFMQKEHIQKYGIPMFYEEITYTENGPFIDTVNKYFIYGRLGFDSTVKQSVVLTDRHSDVLNIVLSKYGNMSPNKLMEISINSLNETKNKYGYQSKERLMRLNLYEKS